VRPVRLFLITLALAGCRDISYDDDPGPTGGRPDARPASGGPDAPVGGGAAGSIKALVANPPAKMAPVSVSGVVVVGRVTSSKNAYAWVQDPGGGAMSGIQIYCQKEKGCTAGYDIIDKLEEGDVIDVTGTYDEYMGAKEIVSPTITKKGTKMPVTALTVSASQVSKDVSSAASAFTPLDQVLVKIEKPAKVTNVAPETMSRDCTTGTGKQYDGFEAQVDGKTINVGLGFYDTVGWCIAACGFECKTPVTLGADYESVTGVVRVVGGQVRVDPPWQASLALPGGPRPDGGVTPTPDGGVTPTPDAGTVVGGDGTVEAVVKNPPADGTIVSLSNVVVVAVETGTSSAQIYVQDLGGGEHSGMLLYCGSGCRSELASLRPGDVIHARGTFKFFSGNTPELIDVDATPLGVTAGVVALRVPAADLAKDLDPASAAFQRLNGVLVEVAGPLDVASVDVPELQSSTTCTGGARYRDGFEVAAGAAALYVNFFFNDNVDSCVAGGCRTCELGPITADDQLTRLRGVARVYKGQADPVVVVSPVDELDFPRAGSIRAVLAGAAEKATVTVEDAVVVGYNPLSSGRGSLFVQDAGGGRWSGIQLFCTADACSSAAATLAPGDVITFTGRFTRYLGTTPEIESAVAPTKSTATAATRAVTIDGNAAGMTALAGSGSFEPYNQVYVTVKGSVSVADLAPTELAVTCEDSLLTGYEGFKASDGSAEYLVADLFAPAYTFCVAGGSCGECVNPVAEDAAWSALSGILRIGRGGVPQIAPVSDADLVAP
jgi:DNA/RNA endonuclease YhcR with UshA esterase domain